MIVKQYYLGCLSHGSYLIGDESTGRAVVVDPRRDIEDYLADAAAESLTITGVINTQFHADFVAGHLELAAATGAWIGYGRAAAAEYAFRPLAHGEIISLGEVQLEILETPGHTWESISIVVRAHAADAVPHAVLTGDTLFVGDVGRPDLAAAVGADPDELARALFRSIHDVLMRLPDDVRVLPAHGAGSACGKNISADLESTIGAQRATNPSVAPMSEAEFVHMVTTGQPAIPQYFAVDAVLNRKERPLAGDPAAVPELDLPAALRLHRAGATILDTRSPHEFAVRHLADSLNVGIDGRFAETTGMVAASTDTFIIVTDPGRAGEVARRLARIGYDNIAGSVDASSMQFRRTAHSASRRILASELKPVGIGDRGAPVVVDVRNPGERAGRCIPGSLHIPLADLVRRHGEIPAGRPVIVHCASGWRSSVGASLLRQRGHDDVTDMIGGYEAWAVLRHPISA